MNLDVAVFTAGEHDWGTVPFGGEYFTFVFAFQVCEGKLVVTEIPKLNSPIQTRAQKDVLNLCIELNTRYSPFMPRVDLSAFSRWRAPLIPHPNAGIFISRQNQVCLGSVQALCHFVVGQDRLLYNVTLFDVNDLEGVTFAAGNKVALVEPS